MNGVYKQQPTNPTHSAFKDPNATVSTPCHWLLLTVRVKESGVDLEQAVKCGHNYIKNGSIEKNWIVRECKTTAWHPFNYKRSEQVRG